MIPGPRCGTNRPRRKITARSYSRTTLTPLIKSTNVMTANVTTGPKPNIVFPLSGSPRAVLPVRSSRGREQGMYQPRPHQRASVVHPDVGKKRTTDGAVRRISAPCLRRAVEKGRRYLARLLLADTQHGHYQRQVIAPFWHEGKGRTMS